MINTEKAIEIADLCSSCFECGEPNSSCMECERRGKYYGAIEMAKHKDEELREYLEEQIEHCKEFLARADFYKPFILSNLMLIRKFSTNFWKNRKNHES